MHACVCSKCWWFEHVLLCIIWSIVILIRCRRNGPQGPPPYHVWCVHSCPLYGKVYEIPKTQEEPPLCYLFYVHLLLLFPISHHPRVVHPSFDTNGFPPPLDEIIRTVGHRIKVSHFFYIHANWEDTNEVIWMGMNKLHFYGHPFYY